MFERAPRSVAAARFLIFARRGLFLDRDAGALAILFAPAAVGIDLALRLGNALAVLDLVIPAARGGLAGLRIGRARGGRDQRSGAQRQQNSISASHHRLLGARLTCRKVNPP